MKITKMIELNLPNNKCTTKFLKNNKTEISRKLKTELIFISQLRANMNYKFILTKAFECYKMISKCSAKCFKTF